MTVPNSRADRSISARRTPPGQLLGLGLPIVIGLLAVVSGSIHLARNFMPLGGPGGGAGGPPPGGPPPGFGPGGPGGGGPGGLMGLIMPHLAELFILNFLVFVVLAVALFVTRLRPRPRMVVDVLLVLVSAATLYVWNTMGRANPSNTGTLALIAETVVIVLAVIDIILVQRWASRASPRRATMEAAGSYSR